MIKHNKNEVALLFSGGIDSTLATVALALKGYEIHLLTMNNGVLNKNEFTESRYNELKEIFPENIVNWKKLICRKLFIEIALENLDENLKTYNSNLICLGCKLSMHTVGVTYCLENNIKIIADGYTRYQSYLAEQVPESIDILKKFDLNFEIEYINPIYFYDNKVEVKKELEDFGLYTKSLESMCALSPAYGVLGKDFSVDDVIRFTKDKLEICEQYILDYMVKRLKIDCRKKMDDVNNTLEKLKTNQ